MSTWKADEKGEVERGEAETTINMPIEIDSMGEHVLTADYLENWKYLASTVSRPIYLGYHTYVHCPPIYIYKSQLPNLTLVSNLFCNNRPVEGCSGKFKINKVTVCDKIPITGGRATYGYDGSSLKGLPLYMFKTAGKVSWNINPGTSNQAEIFIQDITTNYTALQVSVPTVMTGDNTDFTLVARVYHLIHSSVIDQSDIPKGGTISFYLAVPGEDTAMVDDELIYMGMADITTSGYAHIDHCSADIVTGVYTIVAVYNPPEWSAKYIQTTGAGTLFYSSTLVMPKITTDQRFVYNEGESVEATFNSDTSLTGTLELFIDEQLVADMTVTDATSFTFTFDIPLKPVTEALWAYPGIHYMVVRYSTSDGYVYEYLFDFIIRYDTRVLLEHPYGWLPDYPEISYQGYTMYFHVENVNLTTDEHEVLVPSGELLIDLHRSRPVISLDEDTLIFNNDEEGSFTFTTDVSITGTISLSLDGNLFYEMEVDGLKKITPTFIVPSATNEWAIPGKHTLTISFTRADNGKTYSWDYVCYIRYNTMPRLERLLGENDNPQTAKYPDRTLYCEGNPLDVTVDNLDDASMYPTGVVNLGFIPRVTAWPPDLVPREELIINNDEVSNITFDSDIELTPLITVYIDDVEVEEINVDKATSFTTTFIAPMTSDTSSIYYPGMHVLSLMYTDVEGYQFLSEFDLRIRYNTEIYIKNKIFYVTPSVKTLDGWSYTSSSNSNYLEPSVGDDGIHSGRQTYLVYKDNYVMAGEYWDLTIDIKVKELSNFYVGFTNDDQSNVIPFLQNTGGRTQIGGKDLNEELSTDDIYRLSIESYGDENITLILKDFSDNTVGSNTIPSTLNEGEAYYVYVRKTGDSELLVSQIVVGTARGSGLPQLAKHKDYNIIQFGVDCIELEEPVGKYEVQLNMRRIDEGSTGNKGTGDDSGDTGGDEPEDKKEALVTVIDAEAIQDDVIKFDVEVTSDGKPVDGGIIPFTLDYAPDTGGTGDGGKQNTDGLQVVVKDVEAVVGDVVTFEVEVTYNGEPVDGGTVKFTLE